jgi:hypothetical protein
MSTGFSNALDIFLAHAATFEPVSSVASVTAAAVQRAGPAAANRR